MSLKDKLASKLNNKYHKPGESASIVPSWDVRDSIPMIEGQTSAGTFTELICRARGIRFSGDGSLAPVFTGLGPSHLGSGLRTAPENVFPLAPKHHNLAITIAALGFLAIPCLMSLDTYATASSLTVSVTSGQDPVINIPPTPAGIFAESGATTFSVNTTHAAGYSVTASATALSDNTTTISSHSVTAGITKANYSDDTYATTNNLNNTWGFKPSKHRSGSTTINNTGDSAVFLPAPISSSRTLDEVAGATNNTYDIAIGTRIDHTTPISSYNSTITVTVTANPTPYAITYNKNTTATVNNMPTNHTTSDTGTNGETVTLPSTTPTRTGFSFNGWCTTTPTTSNGVDSCSGTTYNAGGTWTINQTSTTNSLTLYAMWNRNSYNVKVNFAGSGVSSVVFTASGYTTRTVSSSGGTASLMYGVQYTVTMNFSSTSYTFDKWALNSTSYGTIGSTSANPTTFTPNTSSASAVITATGKVACQSTVSGTMQAFNPCSSIAKGTTGTLTDSRDSQSYTVAKLEDGKWWMLDNLRLDITNSAILNNLTTLNTHVNAASLASLKSGNRNAGAQYASLGFSIWNSSNKSYAYNQAKANADYKDTVASVTYGPGSGKIGVYYNYCAASAGSYCYDGNTPSSDPDTSTLQDAKYDLCPAGWRMPTSSILGEYQALYETAYGSNATNFRNALSTPLSGFFGYGSAYALGTYGYFWSSTYYDGNYMFSLYVDSSSVLYPSYYQTRNTGCLLRCLLSF